MPRIPIIPKIPIFVEVSEHLCNMQCVHLVNQSNYRCNLFGDDLVAAYDDTNYPLSDTPTLVQRCCACVESYVWNP